MKQEMVTFELAKLFESQGYYSDALDIYRALDEKNPDSQAQAGINRMEMKLAMEDDTVPEKTLEALMEKWLDLIILQHRLDRFKQIKSRLA